MKINFSFFKLTFFALFLSLIIGILNYFFEFLIQDRIMLDSKEYFQAIAMQDSKLAKCNFHFILPASQNQNAKADFILSEPFKKCEPDFIEFVSKTFISPKKQKKLLKLLQTQNEFTLDELAFKIEKNEKQIHIRILFT